MLGVEERRETVFGKRDYIFIDYQSLQNVSFQALPQ